MSAQILELFSPQALVHVVLISFRESVSTERRQWLMSAYQELAQRCGGESAGILYWQVSENMDQRKNWHWVELAVFRDNEALGRFRRHHAHVELSEKMRELADWAIGDIEIMRLGNGTVATGS